MTSRFWAVLVAALATVTPVIGQSNFAIIGSPPKDEQLPQPKSEPQPKSDPEKPSANLPTSPTSPATPSTGWSIMPTWLHSLTPGGDPSWHENCWGSADYLAGWTRPVGTPILVTSSPPGTAQAKAGVLGQKSTAVLFGNEAVEGDAHSGFKLALGSWFSADRTLGYEAGFSFLPSASSNFFANSNGSTILARPFIDANTNSQSSLLVAFPDKSGPTGVKAAGSISVSASSGPFYGAYFDFRESVIHDPGFRLTTLLGYRFINFNDALSIQQTTLPADVGSGGPAIKPGTQITAQDNFTTQNMFNGCDIGFEAEVVRRNWSLSWVAKVAVGELQRDVNINGATQVSVPGSPVNNIPGGLLALSSNSGNHVTDIFTAVPETGLNLTWIITDHVRLRVGYSVLVLMHSARAVDQVDTSVNPKLINSSLNPPASSGLLQQPAFSLNPSNMWLQMVNAGLELRF